MAPETELTDAAAANRERVQAQYLEKYGLTQPDLWKRATCEMALIRETFKDRRYGEPLYEEMIHTIMGATYDEIHDLAWRILDERIGDRSPTSL